MQTKLDRKRQRTSFSKISKKAKINEEPKPLQECFNEKELYCVICMDFPESDIYQCTNSHLLCGPCHKRILESDSCVCPTCRIKLSRDNPCRSRLAELILSKMVMTCPNLQCGQKIQHGELNKHVKELCRYRMIPCKYYPIGCEWIGLSKNCKKHQKTCSSLQWDINSILKRVLERSKFQEKAELKRKIVMEDQQRLMALLNSRCRDIEIRDIVIKKDDNINSLCSQSFFIFGLSWELILENKNRSKTSNNGQSSSSNSL